MKKNTIRAAAVLAILLAVYHAIVFAIPFVHNGAFWLSYAFGLIAFAVLGAAAWLGELRGEGVKSKFYGFPVLKIGAVYFALQIVLGLIVMAVGVIPLWAPLIVYVIALAVAAIGLIAADAMREEIERQDTVQKQNTSAMLALRSRAGTLPGLTDSAGLKKALSDLAESFRFSDPVSSDALIGIEQDLMSLLDELQKALLEKDNASAETLCRQTGLKLVERNRLCKLCKNK